VAADLYSGALIDSSDLPDAIVEHLFAYNYGYSLEYIRRLPPKEYKEHVEILLLRHRLSAAASGLLGAAKVSES